MSNDKQQTAVEWLFEQVWINPVSKLPEILEQAKEMEKEQIINTFFEGAYGGDIMSGEQYYNETYGGGEK
jgi:hypothetical protein